MRTNEQGRSMIEMLGVLAIVGVLSVGGIAGYSKAMNKFKTNKVIEQVNMISTNIRTLYSSQKSYDNLDEKTAIKTGLIPGEMYDASVASTSKISNAFGGDVLIKPLDYMSTGDKQAFVIAISKVPQASCVSIATTEWGGDAGSGLIAMYVGTGTVANASTSLAPLGSALTGGSNVAVTGASVEANALPYSVVKAAQDCGKESTIAWKYI